MSIFGARPRYVGQRRGLPFGRVIIALVIALLKALIGFVGFLALAIKIVIVIAFLALFAFVGMMLFRTWQEKQRTA